MIYPQPLENSLPGEMKIRATHGARAQELTTLYVAKLNGNLPRKSKEDVTIADMRGTGASDAAGAVMDALGI